MKKTTTGSSASGQYVTRDAISGKLRNMSAEARREADNLRRVLDASEKTSASAGKVLRKAGYLR